MIQTSQKNDSMKRTLLFLLILCVCAPICARSYRKISDGIVITLPTDRADAPRMVRLRVVNERIMRVTATPEKKFPKDKSLVVQPEAYEATPFSVEESGDTVTLVTARMGVSINTKTGEVAFTDDKGNIRLQERIGGGKRFAPITVDGTSAYSYWQQFESPADEAFYGLGQHQSDEFNYKGKNESLFQYNTKVSVPFIVSNKNYGLLFDTYSLCKWGDSREYAQLSEVFDLYDVNGEKGALTATYTPDKKNKKTQTLTRRESNIYYEDIKTVLDLPQDFPLYGSRVVYDGEIAARESGDYRFLLYYAGYVKVYIDGRLLVPERWRTAWNPNSYKFAVSLQAGKRVPIRIEWLPDGEVSYLGLRALTPVSAEEQGRLSWYSEMSDALDYYYMAGENIDEVIAAYRQLTGKAQIMPRWAMGFWQSRERYKTQKEILTALKEFRNRQIPIDNIVLDWSYWREAEWGSHEFDEKRFPTPKAMVDSIHALHGRMMISVWPKFYMTTEHYKEFDRKGLMYQQAIKDSIRDWIGPGYIGSFYDAYSAEGRKIFWRQMREHLYPLGIDAWWMDASEPNVRDCTDMEYRKALCGPTALGPSTQYFNAYALMNAEAIYNGQREADTDRRVFLLTRSGFAGLQRYSTATWSGDIATRWEDMKAQISAGLNFSISGIPYWSMDIGGFCVEKRYENGFKHYNKTGKENDDHKEWRELNTRWYQFGAFAPIFRSHGQYPYREIYNIAPEGHPAYKSIAYYTRLRYHLMPYIYTLAGMTWHDDYTIMRPLVMDFPSDNNVLNIGDQYMFGPSFMVCPVYTYGARTREVYFPATSGWYDFYSGAYIVGGQTYSVSAPYERMPLYVREGSIVPFGPDLQYSDERLADTLTLYVYTGRDAEFSFYEDENVNYNYEQGAYMHIPMSYSEVDATLTIDAVQGSYPGMPTRRTIQVVVVSPLRAVPFDRARKPDYTIDYIGEKVVLKLK